MEIRTLCDLDLNELLNTFNESFSDYFVPLQLTPDQLKDRIKTDNINFSYSAGAFLDNKLIGFILHGYDLVDSKRVVYNAGTGVIPDQRKQALTKHMYDFILPSLRADKIDYLVLEVIEQNVQAFKVYQKVGFHVERKLVCYKGQIKATGRLEIIIKEIVYFFAYCIFPNKRNE